MAESGTVTLDGKAVSGAVLEALKTRIKQEQLRPHLHVISVGEDSASQVYVKQKRLAAEKTCIIFSQTSLPIEATLDQLRQAILARNADVGVHGIIVQLPLPAALQQHEREVLNLVDPAKDVDCFHPLNYGQLAIGEPTFLPATPAGVIKLIDHYGIATKGKRCVILGKSNIVGKPLALLMANESGPAATVFFCDQYTENVWELTRQADILVVAAGKHHLVNDPAVLREDGQVAIFDVGIHRVQNAEGKTVLQGDVNAAAVRSRCRFLTPVPGGVGPMTVACLLEQVVEAASRVSRCSNRPGRALKGIIRSSLLEGQRFTKAELAALMVRLDPNFPTGQLASAVATLGLESDGRISLEEFIDWACGLEQCTGAAI